MTYRQQQESEETFQQQLDYVDSLVSEGELDYEYSYFLMNKHPEEAGYKEALIKLMESGKYQRDFCEFMVGQVGIHHKDFMKWVEQMEGTKQ